jgi:hypothetical protein
VLDESFGLTTVRPATPLKVAVMSAEPGETGCTRPLETIATDELSEEL